MLASPSTWIFALGQAFFSLSVAGNGTLIYGSYLSDKENIPASAAKVALFDTIAAVLAALVIIPAMATTGAQLNQGETGTIIHLPAESDSFHAGTAGDCNHFLCSRIPCRDDITDQLIRSTNCNGTGKTTFIPRTCMRCHCSNRNHRFTSDSRHRLHMDGYSFYIHLSTGRGTRRNHVLLGM